MDVTSKTEGKAFADATGVPLLVKYDTRIRDTVAKGVTKDVTDGIEVELAALKELDTLDQVLLMLSNVILSIRMILRH